MNPRRPALGATLLALGCLGCIPIPIPTKQQGLVLGRGRLPEGGLLPGTTTREEVLLRCGDPTWVLEDQNVFVYRWTTHKNMLLVVAPGGAAGEDLHLTNLFLVAFDARGVLLRSGLRKTHQDAWKVVNEWVAEGGTRPVGNPLVRVLDPWPEPAPARPFPAGLRIESIQDLRPAPLDQWPLPAMGGRDSQTLRLRLPAARLVQAVLEAQVPKAGAEAQSAGGILLLSGELRAFRLQVQKAALIDHFTVTGSLSLRLRLRPLGGSGEERVLEVQRQLTRVGRPSKESPGDLCGEVLTGLLEDLLRQLAEELPLPDPPPG